MMTTFVVVVVVVVVVIYCVWHRLVAYLFVPSLF